MSNTKSVACFGSHLGGSGDPVYDEMVKVGGLLAERDITVMTGGFGGAGSQAPIEGVKKAGGRVQVHTMWDLPVCDLLDGPEIHTSSFEKYEIDLPSPNSGLVMNPSAESQYGDRMGRLLGADAFVFCPGGFGTKAALYQAIHLNQVLWGKEWKEDGYGQGVPKRIAILACFRQNFGQHAYSLREELLSSGLPNAILRSICFPFSAEEAVNWVLMHEMKTDDDGIGAVLLGDCNGDKEEGDPENPIL